MDCLELNLPYQDLSQTQALLSFGILSNLLSFHGIRPGLLSVGFPVAGRQRAAGSPSPAVYTLPGCSQLRAHLISFGFTYPATLPNFPP